MVPIRREVLGGGDALERAKNMVQDAMILTNSPTSVATWYTLTAVAFINVKYWCTYFTVAF